MVWAGDNNVLDRTGKQLTQLPDLIGPDLIGQKDLIGPDFLAVVDATKGSPSYGKVVNTATVGPLVENEPHHMQYIWHKGNNIFAGGLFTDVTYVIDTSKLPRSSLKHVNLPTDTLCGSVPDAYWVTKDGTAYGTYMGGPDVPGPCTYSDGTTRIGNGFAGSPGEVVRLDQNGKTVYEAPATPKEGETTQRCDNIPSSRRPTCANPHGIQAREDLNMLIDQRLRRAAQHHPQPGGRALVVPAPADGPDLGHLRPGQAEAEGGLVPARRPPGGQGRPPGGAARGDGDHGHQPAGPQGRVRRDDVGRRDLLHAGHHRRQAGLARGLRRHDGQQDRRTRPEPVRRRLQRRLDPDQPRRQVPLPRRHRAAQPSGYGQRVPAVHPQAGHPEAAGLRREPDVQHRHDRGDRQRRRRVGLPARSSTSLDAPGGPHWGALDNFELGKDGYYHETTDVKRIAFSNYFVARTGLNGDHRVCLVDVNDDQTLTIDNTFKDENTGATCIDFDRTSWPHGDWGPAKPHSMLFVVADADVK